MCILLDCLHSGSYYVTAGIIAVFKGQECVGILVCKGVSEGSPVDFSVQPYSINYISNVRQIGKFEKTMNLINFYLSYII